jgi:hypothetical protein
MELLVLVALAISVVNTVCLAIVKLEFNKQNKHNKDFVLFFEKLFDKSAQQTKLNASQCEVNRMLYEKINAKEDPFMGRLESYFRDSGVH